MAWMRFGLDQAPKKVFETYRLCPKALSLRFFALRIERRRQFFFSLGKVIEGRVRMIPNISNILPLRIYRRALNRLQQV